jgi:thiamine biosynthesis lipoprotein
MRKTDTAMNMIINVEIVDSEKSEIDVEDSFEKVFSYFKYVEKRFSFFKDDSEVSLINKNKIKESEYSDEMKEILFLSEKTKKESKGYFDVIDKNGLLNPSGLVKGWAINNASNILIDHGFKNFYVEAGGDIQVKGLNSYNQPWKIGIRNPLNPENEIVKVLYLTDKGLATSGTYARGQHIYNPHKKIEILSEILSISVIGPNIYEADRFATSAFAMGREGINFIESLEGFEAYMIDKDGMATMTTNLESYINNQ